MHINKKSKRIMFMAATAIFIIIIVSYVYGETLKEFVSTCAAEDNTGTKNSFGGACDAADGSNLELNDVNYETHTYSKSKYGGVRIQSVNTSVDDCKEIRSVRICYEMWGTAGDTLSDCDVSVSNNSGTSYTTINSTCPGTAANPGVVCNNVTSTLTWRCSHFFNTSGTRAQAKSELTRTNGGTANIATWDVLYFDIIYQGTCTPPMSGNWAVNCSKNCYWNSNLAVPGNVTLSQAGTVTLAKTMNFTGSNQMIFQYTGCEFRIISGGQIVS